MSELKVAVVGCGGIGSVHMARWANVPGARLSAVCDLNGSAAADAAGKYGAAAFEDRAAMLAGGGFDIVDICTPPNEHAAVASAALAAGAHVLCEKPLARTPEEARTIVDEAARRERLLMTAFCHRFHPPIVFARELIAAGDLGRVIMFRNRFSGHFAGIEDRWFSDPEVAGGGSLLDTAIHSVDLFRFLVGEVRGATGRVGTFLPGLRVDDSAAFVLQSEDGAIGVIESSWATPGGRNVVEIYGTAGSCIVDYDSGELTYRTADMAFAQTRVVEGVDRFQAEVEHFAEAVRGTRPLAVTGRDGLRANEVVAEVYASARAAG
ncbi:MAG: Gfo/Idh/MocA family oxidoreductase [Chthonomonadales bacterium]|nr:Gfo/Idh/MocA family oxidoreductase [Chthonomonadales bacterium]